MKYNYPASIYILCCVVWNVSAAPCSASNFFQPSGQAGAQNDKSNPEPTQNLAKDSATDLAKDLLPNSNSGVLQETQKLLPQFQKSETKHYAILSDCSPQDIAMVGTLLEATYVKYHEVCDSLGWKPNLLRHKLVAVLFRDQRNFNDFAMQVDKVNKSWVMGYYSPLADRLVFFKSDSAADVKKVMADLNAQTKQVQEIGAAQKSPGQALRPNQEVEHAQTQLAAEKDRIQDSTEAIFVSTAVHEAAHQLFFHTDIQRPGVTYPLWLAEGLATNFETERTDIQFGYHVDNWRRRDAFKLAWEKDGLVPLEIMLTQERFSDGTNSAEAIADFYAQSYVFTNWLMRERPTELRLYLESLLDGSFAIAGQRKKKFEAIFGPIARLERSWARYEGQRNKEFLSCPNCKRVLAKLPKASKPISDLSAKPAGSQPETVPGNAIVPANPVEPVASKPPTQPETQSTPAPPK